jgi:hypothetical protein
MPYTFREFVPNTQFLKYRIIIIIKKKYFRKKITQHCIEGL